MLKKMFINTYDHNNINVREIERNFIRARFYFKWLGLYWFFCVFHLKLIFTFDENYEVLVYLINAHLLCSYVHSNLNN